MDEMRERARKQFAGKVISKTNRGQVVVDLTTLPDDTVEFMLEFAREELRSAARDAREKAEKLRDEALQIDDVAKSAFLHGKANALIEWADWLERRAEGGL